MNYFFCNYAGSTVAEIGSDSLIPIQLSCRQLYWNAKSNGVTVLTFVEHAKIPSVPLSVIPVKAGIQLFQDLLDPGGRRGDGLNGFLRDLQS